MKEGNKESDGKQRFQPPPSEQLPDDKDRDVQSTDDDEFEDDERDVDDEDADDVTDPAEQDDQISS